MNKKGFTLTELLAVIVILSLLALITGSVVVTNIKSSKEKLYNVQIENIRLAGESYIEENKMTVITNMAANNLNCVYVTLQTLKNKNYIDKTIKDPRKNTNFSNLYITGTNTENNPTTFKFTVLEDIPSNCLEYVG